MVTMMKSIHTLILLALIPLASAAPIESCQEQANCLSVDIASNCTDNHRLVCLKWYPGEFCCKAPAYPTNEVVSHSCAGVGGAKDPLGDGVEEWPVDLAICQLVKSGDVAIFGVKDGKGCSDAGAYNINGTSETVACSGPENVCHGNNAKECAWHIPTPVCQDDPTPPDCAGDHVCHVVMPCEDDMGCPCTEFKFVTES